MNVKRLYLSTVLFSTSSVLCTTHRAHLTKEWYSSNTGQLTQDLQHLFKQAQQELSSPENSSAIRAVVAPHAAMTYAGLAAAASYAPLMSSNGKNKKITRVFVLAPSHYESFYGIGLPDFNAYQTPLGIIPIDHMIINQLKKNPLYYVNPAAFAKEHAVEMQLPYLQHALDHWKFIPLIIGQLSPDDVIQCAKILEPYCNDTTLVVVSSDFTHYGKRFGYTIFDHYIHLLVRTLDRAVIKAVCACQSNDYLTIMEKTHATVCGNYPLQVLISLGQQRSWRGQLACYYQSAQNIDVLHDESIATKLFNTVPDHHMSHSVSYAAIIFTSSDETIRPFKNFLTQFEQNDILWSCRATITNQFHQPPLASFIYAPMVSAYTMKTNGTFITLRNGKELRGCIGTVTPTAPLYETIPAMARAAAFNDSRFSPVTAEQLPQLSIEVSVLQHPQSIASYTQINVGKQGIILNKFDTRGNLVANALFLPHVATEFGWNLPQTLEQLAQKAGLSPDGWKQATFEVFEAFDFSDAQRVSISAKK